MKQTKTTSARTLNPAHQNVEPAEFRGQILAAAYRCIDRIGLERTTIMDIAAEAKISRPTIYKYVGKKDKIVEAISDLESIKVKSEVRARLKRSDSFEETLSRALILIVEVTRKNRYLTQVMGTIDFPAMALQPGSGYLERQKVWWGSLIKNALASGEIAPDLSHDDVIHWLTSSLHLLLVKSTTGTSSQIEMRRFVRRFIVRPLIPAAHLSA